MRIEKCQCRIGLGEYRQATDDDTFVDRLPPAIEKVRFLLGTWAFNSHGLIYVPLTGQDRRIPAQRPELAGAVHFSSLRATENVSPAAVRPLKIRNAPQGPLR